jgi:hypothetical protein
MMGLQWASMVTPLIEHGTIKEGELIQIASEKRITPSKLPPQDMLHQEDQEVEVVLKA